MLGLKVWVEGDESVAYPNDMKISNERHEDQQLGVTDGR